MTEKKFSDLWVQIGNAAQDIVNTCNDGTYFNKDKKEYVEYEYNKLNKKCKDNHMDFSKSTTHRIDRHKVASCVAGAILSTTPMEFHPANQDGEVQRNRMSYLANETLALFSALSIVKSFIRADVDNQMALDQQSKEYFLQHGYIFPCPQHGQYIPWLLYLLQDSSTIGYNILSFSNILYLIESYTFLQIQMRLGNSNIGDINK